MAARPSRTLRLIGPLLFAMASGCGDASEEKRENDSDQDRLHAPFNGSEVDAVTKDSIWLRTPSASMSIVEDTLDADDADSTTDDDGADSSRSVQGVIARWQQDTVVLIVDASLEQASDRAFEAAAYAVDEWQRNVANLPTLVVRRGKTSSLEYRENQQNQFILRFPNEDESLTSSVLAHCVVRYSSKKQKIYESDIVLNGQHPFGDVGAGEMEVFDLQSVLTHEMGHLLGLGEELEDATSTMYPYSLAGETTKRSLSRGDIERMEALYERPLRAGGCDMTGASGHAPRASSWAVAALAVAAAIRARRRLSTESMSGTGARAG